MFDVMLIHVHHVLHMIYNILTIYIWYMISENYMWYMINEKLCMIHGLWYDIYIYMRNYTWYTESIYILEHIYIYMCVCVSNGMILNIGCKSTDIAFFSFQDMISRWAVGPSNQVYSCPSAAGTSSSLLPSCWRIDWNHH